MKVQASTLSRILGDWAEPGVPLPQALSRAIEDVIDAGLIPAGATLPSQRALAATLGISRGTVTAAISDLDARGIVLTVQGSGCRVRSGPGAGQLHEGRMFSFTNSPRDVIDLSTGALPASHVATEVFDEQPSEVKEYLHTDGYFPAGLPILRSAIAAYLTAGGIPTTSAQILVTSGAQHGTFLALSEVLRSGDLALAEDPSYRGALGVMRQLGARIEGIPLRDGGIDTALVEAAIRRRPSALYCQTGVHNPCGSTMRAADRLRLGEIIAKYGLVTVEDVCSRDVTLTGRPATTLATVTDPAMLVMVGTLSKLFWGGIRVGWIRAEPWRIRAFLERRQITDLACSVTDQLYAVRMMERVDEAVTARSTMLAQHLDSTEVVIRSHFPTWSWEPVVGGSGLWVDTHRNATSLVELGKRTKVKLVAGPAFSPHGGHETKIRLPLWHDTNQLHAAFERLAMH